MRLEGRVDRALLALGVRDGDRLGVACSGGADSMALLHLAVRAPIDLDLTVLHVDHGMRPDSSADALFVEQQAAQLDLKCRVVRVEVRREPRASIEASARDARYAVLDAAARELGLSWIATAHTLDDQAETVLLRMLRGGRLSGIAAVRGAIVRPLLDQSGAELRDWLHAHAIPWREDPTNADVRLERNWIRSVLLPLLRERREGVTSVLARIAEHSRADDDVLDGLASELFERAAVDDVGVLFPASDFDPLPPALRTRLVRSALRNIGADPSWTDLDAIAQLRSGRRVRCGAATVWRSNECIAFTRAPLAIPGPLELPAEGIAELPAWGIRVRVGRASASPWTWRTALPEGSPTIVRSRRTGDRVRTQVGTRKVQDVLVDAKVPSSLRDLVPIIAVGEDALAVVGLTAYPVASSTVVDVEPCSASWSRKVLWTRASA